MRLSTTEVRIYFGEKLVGQVGVYPLPKIELSSEQDVIEFKMMAVDFEAFKEKENDTRLVFSEGSVLQFMSEFLALDNSVLRLKMTTVPQWIK